jgi:hypothetical protein
MPIPEHAVRAIHDLPSLLQFLERELQWKLPQNPTVEEVTFEWSASELRLNEAAQSKLKDGSVLQLRPMTNDQPWGIFIVNFTDGQVYKTALRQVLRGLVPKRRRDSNLPAWKHENILFICTTANQQFTFAHFKGEKPERAKLVRFSWSPDEPIRTLCEFNLPALKMPEDTSRWTEEWQVAFDVEKVTNEFFREYRRVFENAERLIHGIKDKNELRLFTQKLFNRLLFIRFLEKKDWLTINGRKEYLRALWDDYKKNAERGSNFYRERLRLLFFSGLNAPNEVNQIGINRGAFSVSSLEKFPTSTADCSNKTKPIPMILSWFLIKQLSRRWKNCSITSTSPLRKARRSTWMLLLTPKCSVGSLKSWSPAGMKRAAITPHVPSFRSCAVKRSKAISAVGKS